MNGIFVIHPFLRVNLISVEMKHTNIKFIENRQFSPAERCRQLILYFLVKKMNERLPNDYTNPSLEWVNYFLRYYIDHVKS